MSDQPAGWQLDGIVDSLADVAAAMHAVDQGLHEQAQLHSQMILRLTNELISCRTDLNRLAAEVAGLARTVASRTDHLV